MPLIRIISALLLLVLLAEAASTRGLYGEIGYSYEQYMRSDKYATTERGTFLQDYSIGYDSYLYSPLFLMYDVEVTLNYEDTKADISGTDQTKKIRGTEYDIDLKFIEKTNYPFRVFAVKRQRPYWDITPGRSYYLDEDTEQAGINGLVRMDIFNIRYSANILDTKRMGNEEEDKRKDIKYTLSLDKKMKDSALWIDYIYNDRDVDRTIFASNYVLQDSVYQTHEITNDVNLRYEWEISPTLKLHARGQYFDNNASNLVNTMGTVSLSWRPTEKYTAGLDATVNSYNGDFGGVDTVSVAANSDYRASKFLTLDQSLTMMRSSGDFGEYDSSYIRAGARYNKPFGDNYTFRANGYITFNRYYSDLSDFNETKYENNIVTYSAGSGISKYFVPVKGTLSFNGLYTNSEATASESNEQISVNTLFTTKPIPNLDYTLRADYARTNIDYTNSLTNSDRGVVVADRYSAETGIKYSTTLTRKGRVSAELGIVHSMREDTTGAAVTRTLPRGNIDAYYRPFRTLTLTARGSVHQDVQAEITTYTGSSDLTWNVRQTMVHLGVKYMEQAGGFLGQRQDTRLNAEIRRRF
ncbi:MAG: hypothetical protein ABFR02_05125 [Campylobacterota bacterium]